VIRPMKWSLSRGAATVFGIAAMLATLGSGAALAGASAPKTASIASAVTLLPAKTSSFCTGSSAASNALKGFKPTKSYQADAKQDAKKLDALAKIWPSALKGPTLSLASALKSWSGSITNTSQYASFATALLTWTQAVEKYTLAHCLPAGVKIP
jgi:hypothetical protein